LEGTNHPITIYTDHSNLPEFMKKQVLHRIEVRWAAELSKYNFVFKYRSGSSNGKADALSHRSGDLPKEGDGCSRPTDSILSSKNFELFTAASSILADNTSFTQEIKDSIRSDSLAQSILQALDSSATRHSTIALGEVEIEDDQLYIQEKLYIPDNEELRAKIIRLSHNHPAAGHPGIANTFEHVSRNYWWLGMRHTIRRYVSNCDTCHRIKPIRHAPYGNLRPL
jgi:hypothetical protein